MPTRAGSHPFPSPAVIQGQLLCCVFLQPQEQNKVCRNDRPECFPEGSILRNSPAGCGTSLGFNLGRVWRIYPGTVPGLSLPRTSGDQLLGSSNPTTVCDSPSPGGQLVPEHNPATQQRATGLLPGGLLAQADTEEAGKLRCCTA